MSRDWIRVKDRLPETGSLVLIYSEATTFALACLEREGYWHVLDVGRDMDIFDVDSIAYWLPIPDLPE